MLKVVFCDYLSDQFFLFYIYIDIRMYFKVVLIK